MRTCQLEAREAAAATFLTAMTRAGGERHSRSGSVVRMRVNGFVRKQLSLLVSNPRDCGPPRRPANLPNSVWLYHDLTSHPPNEHSGE